MTSPTSNNQTERPTNVRYTVLALLCSLTFLLYLDRVWINQAAVRIKDELNFTGLGLSCIHNAFMLAYMVFELPTGRWGDKYGSRLIVMRIVVWWSLFTALTGAVSSFLPFVLVRFLFGAGEAGALPNVARIIPCWFPERSRSAALGWVTGSMLLGGVFAPTGAQVLMAELGWRWSFAVLGAVGVAWAAAFAWWFRDLPAEHGWVNAAERRLIAEDTAPGGDDHPPVPWRTVLRSLNFWLMSGVISCGAFTAYLYFQWFSTYLQEGMGVSEAESAPLVSLVLAGGAAGAFVGGAAGQLMRWLTGSRRLTRILGGSTGFLGASACMLIGLRSQEPAVLCFWFFVSFALHYIQLTTWWTAATELCGRHVGSLVGLMNAISIGAGMVSSFLFGWVSDRMLALGHAGRDRYDPVLYLCVGVYFIGAIVWLFINADRPMVPADTDNSAAKGSAASRAA